MQVTAIAVVRTLGDIVKVINSKIIVSYNLCPTKSFKYYKGDKGHVSEYENLIIQEEIKIKEAYLSKVEGKFQGKFISPFKRIGFFKDVKLEHAGYEAFVDMIEVDNKGEVVPIFFSENKKVSKSKKIEMQWIKFIFSLKGIRINKARLVNSKKDVHIQLKSHNEKTLVPIIQSVKDFEKSPPRVILNRHCQICEFKDVVL